MEKTCVLNWHEAVIETTHPLIQLTKLSSVSEATVTDSFFKDGGGTHQRDGPDTPSLLLQTPKSP